ncbi:response regulator [Nocardioides aequoreus]|uniref:response regulator n=1 Tax=Nocardioides aequoreus TaxID=397278 RepID=UPI000563DD4C|nr:response regulator transcription factor [Nocardioides aequoreus]
MAGVTRVVLVDDDPLVRSGLALILGGARDLQVVAQAADGEEALEVVARERPDVVLMDIRMPRLNGLEATERLLAPAEPPAVLVLTTFDADEHVVRALAAGAAGFLLKDTAPDLIVDAVRRVARGEPILSPSVTRQLIAQVQQLGAAGPDAEAEAARDRLAALTDREREVAEAIARGLSNSDIARELHLSVPTVKTHISRLFTKLRVDNRVQIAIAVLAAAPDS